MRKCSLNPREHADGIRMIEIGTAWDKIAHHLEVSLPTLRRHYAESDYVVQGTLKQRQANAPRPPQIPRPCLGAGCMDLPRAERMFACDEPPSARRICDVCTNMRLPDDKGGRQVYEWKAD